jgi:cellulose synthase/poly-beta-1,6-N-acetylglucosamine synthase-like glycosyltransferase
MSHVLLALVAILAGLISIPVLVLFAECLLAALPRAGDDPVEAGEPRTVVLIPAHDEEAGLGPTLAALLSGLPGWARVLVVADNCSDGTARIARQAGAEVIERTDPAHRGKGYALHFGLTHLQQDPPQVVIIVDADCSVSVDGIARLARLAHARQRPIQADNVVEPTPDATVRARISAFAFTVRNRVRPRGLLRIGMPCQLMGTGMAIPYAQCLRVNFAGSHLAEDMLLGVELARLGFPPLYTRTAAVVSAQPNNANAALAQRRRWEQGHLRTALPQAPKLLVDSLRRGSPTLLALALDMIVPPLSLLVAIAGAHFAAACAIAAFLGSTSVLVWSSANLALLAAAVGTAWVLEGRRLLPARHLLLVPFYVAWKLPVYAALLLGRGERRWKRTDRPPAPDEQRPAGPH